MEIFLFGVVLISLAVLIYMFFDTWRIRQRSDLLSRVASLNDEGWSVYEEGVTTENIEELSESISEIEENIDKNKELLEEAEEKGFDEVVHIIENCIELMGSCKSMLKLIEYGMEEIDERRIADEREDS